MDVGIGDAVAIGLSAVDQIIRNDPVAYGNIQFCPRNAVEIITLFGGTNPSYYGYRHRATIVGNGRTEQKAFRPGFSKEAYDTRGRDLFDHIAPREVTEAILNQVSLL